MTFCAATRVDPCSALITSHMSNLNISIQKMYLRCPFTMPQNLKVV